MREKRAKWIARSRGALLVEGRAAANPVRVGDVIGVIAMCLVQLGVASSGVSAWLGMMGGHTRGGGMPALIACCSSCAIE